MGVHADRGKEESAVAHGIVVVDGTEKRISLKQIGAVVLDRSNTDEQVAEELIPIEASEVEYWNLPELRLDITATRPKLTKLVLGPNLSNCNINFLSIKNYCLSNLTHLHLPASVTELPEFAFGWNNTIEKITAEGVVYIGGEAINSCGSYECSTSTPPPAVWVQPPPAAYIA